MALLFDIPFSEEDKLNLKKSLEELKRKAFDRKKVFGYLAFEYMIGFFAYGIGLSKNDFNVFESSPYYNSPDNEREYAIQMSNWVRNTFTIS